ncbi:uncharacterized protein LOC110254739 [Exaiptasia diaphana]|uniref:Uncharacterized protein n=1 Tax=Exaiptasia diaphana TaxID=2652724 RepID=A0A913YAS6_EXADI|nr:uncharacterized protein LOC110254739 [Exaiptasia diaphana]
MWPVIVNISLSNSEVCRLLRSGKNNKVRLSENTGEDVIIFPLSSVAFFLLNSGKIIDSTDGFKTINANLVERLEKFNQIHRHGYVIISLNTQPVQQFELLILLQERFSKVHLNFIPVSSSIESVQCMDNIAKVTCKPLIDVIKERLQKLQSSAISESVILQILSSLGLNMHDCSVLHDGCQSIANIAMATEEELMDYSLDHETAKKIVSFFQNDKQE